MVSESRISGAVLMWVWLIACLLIQVVASFTSLHGNIRHVNPRLARHVQTYYAPWADTVEATEYEMQQRRIQDRVRRLQERQHQQLLDLQQQKTHKQVARRQAQQKIQTLYDVLGAPKNATRAELKKCYAMLARKTHPDAMIGMDVDTRQEEVFGDVAAAWRTLSNTKSRQKYDRQLRAKEFAVEVENMVAEMSKRTMPMAMQVIETYAVPTFLKTATTAMASASAAADELSHSGNLGTAFVSAVKAGRRAVREVDKHLLQAATE